MTWAAEAGKTYAVQATGDLGSAWQELRLPVTTLGQEASAVDADAVSTNRRFYRVVKVE